MSEKSYEPSDEDIRILRDWLRKMPHIVQDIDDYCLKCFIKGCKGRLEKTKSVLENYNALGVKYPEFCGHLDILDPIIQTYLTESRIFILPKILKGATVLFASLDIHNDNHDPYKVHLHELFRYINMLFYVQLWEKNLTDKMIMVLDWRKMVIQDFREVTPMFLKKCLEVLETSLPIRLQAIHNIYVPQVLVYFINLVKSLAKKKIADRIYFHSKMETFLDKVPQEMLPKDYGGDESDINTLHNDWKKKVESYRDRLVEEHLKMRKLDTLRPKTNEINEMVGTFKTLNVD